MVEFDHGLVRPEPVANLRSHARSRRVFQQQEQELEGLLAQVKADAVLAQFASANIQFEGSETI